MSFKVEDILFDLFTKYDKDTDNTGLVGRFHNMLGADFDTNELKKIDNIYDLCLLADTCEAKLLPFLETLLGIPFITNNEQHRRNIIKNIFDIYKNKGNYISYNIVFRALGYGTVELEKIDDSYDFNLKLVDYPNPLTNDDIRIIVNANNFLQPLYVGLYSIEADKIYDSTYIEILANGDLVYNSFLDITFSLNANGNLYVTNNTTYNYFINDQGDLIRN